MTLAIPALSEFRIERQDNGLIHLVFDCQGRSMNVFSNKAIHELGAFADWLRLSDVRGVVVRSGKASGFCAGADLTELGVAYDMIVAAPAYARFDMAFNHFFPLGHAIRRLESSGVPVAAAIAGVALGGGTQRMPRVVGLELGLEVLLLGRNLAGREAIDAGLVDAIVPEGEEVAAAEAWLLSDAATSVQPWDRSGATPLTHAEIAPAIERHRARELARMLGHEPAPLAILDCVELGLIQPIDGAIRAEMSVFSGLIQRAEARNMIRTLFLGKQAYDKASRDGSLAPAVNAAAEQIKAVISEAVAGCPDLRLAGFLPDGAVRAPVQARPGADFWIRSRADLLAALSGVSGKLRTIAEPLAGNEGLQLDYAVTANGAIPAYLGGVSGLAEVG